MLRELKLRKDKIPSSPPNADMPIAYEPFRHVNEEEFMIPPSTVKDFRQRGPSRFLVTMQIMSAAVALGIIGINVAELMQYHQYKGQRMLWQHGLGLKAWPPNVDLASVSTSVVFAVAGLTVVVSVISLIMSRRSARTTSRNRTAFTSVEICAHLFISGGWVAAVLVLWLYRPSLSSWSCLNHTYAQTGGHNSAGLEEICSESIATFAAGILIAVLELAIVMSLCRRHRKYRVRSGKRSMQASRGYDKLKEPRDIQAIPMLGVAAENKE